MRFSGACDCTRAGRRRWAFSIGYSTFIISNLHKHFTKPEREQHVVFLSISLCVCNVVNFRGYSFAIRAQTQWCLFFFFGCRVMMMIGALHLSFAIVHRMHGFADDRIISTDNAERARLIRASGGRDASERRRKMLPKSNDGTKHTLNVNVSCFASSFA